MLAPSPASLDPAVLRAHGTVWLDTARPEAEGANARGRLFTEPETILTARAAREVEPLLAGLDAHLAAGRYVAGFLAYEAGYALEPGLFAAPEDGLLGWFGVYDAPAEVDGAQAEAALAAAAPAGIRDARFALDRADYRERIAAIRALIREGDVYQINLTAPVRFRLDGDPLGLYRSLRDRQRVPYGAVLNVEDARVLSLTPELFFRIDSGASRRTLTTRPMKGTVRRGASPAEDDRLAEALAADPKNRAENLMIVDLLRNDLSRLAAPGGVRVPRLFETTRYETVIQMTSTVEATLRDGVTLGETLRALFPCGSVTGAPKLRAMQRIRELEDGPRGVYCGAIGYAAPDGSAVFSVPIRTAVVRDGEGVLGVGSGVVWDSGADAEYDECLLKAAFLTGLTS